MANERFDTPYAGRIHGEPGATIRDEANAQRRPGDDAVSAVHLLVSGKTGSGKSRTVLAPNIIRWGSRPVVALSSKGDLAEITIAARAAKGPVFLLDLSGEVRESELQGAPVTRVVSDPCALIDTDDQALEMAGLLIEVGSLGTGGGQGGGGDSFWSTLAMAPLAALLRAGGWYPDPATGEDVWGGGIRWALAACGDPGPDKLTEADATDLDTPNWDTAARRGAVQRSGLGDWLLNAKKLDPKQRDSIGINARVALSAWMYSTVAGDGRTTPFHPRMLAQPGATLYIVSPMSGAAAPAASALLTQVVNFWRKRVGKLPPVLFVLDELPNGAPLPRLANWVGEARGLGIRIVAAVQATSQFEPRWGAAGLKVLRDIFPAVLILPGAPEKELLEAAAFTAGVEERTTGSTGGDHGTSQSRDKFDALSAADLLPDRKGFGRLLLGGRPGLLVALPDLANTGLV